MDDGDEVIRYVPLRKKSRRHLWRMVEVSRLCIKHVGGLTHLEQGEYLHNWLLRPIAVPHPYLIPAESRLADSCPPRRYRGGSPRDKGLAHYQESEAEIIEGNWSDPLFLGKVERAKPSVMPKSCKTRPEDVK